MKPLMCCKKFMDVKFGIFGLGEETSIIFQCMKCGRVEVKEFEDKIR